MIPKWTKVTVYVDDSWESQIRQGKNPEVRYNGVFLKFIPNGEQVKVLTNSGYIIQRNTDKVQFHLNDILKPQEQVIPEGTEVICYSGGYTESNEREEACRAKFLKIGYSYDDCGDRGIGNYSVALVLKNDGSIGSFPVDFIKVIPEDKEEIQKDDSLIQKRLKSI